MGMKKIVKGYYKQFYTHKSDNLEEMEQFLQRHKFQKLTQEEIDNLICLYLLNKLNQLPKQKVPGPAGFTCEF